MFAERQTVLHVTEVTGGGVEHAIAQYIETLDGLEHVVVAPRDGGLASIACAEFVPFERRGAARSFEVRRVVERLRPALVHAHSSWAGLHTRLVGLRVPVAYQPHAFAFSGYASSPLVRRGYRAAEKALSRRAASFMTLSEHETLLARSLNPSAQIARVVNTSGIAAHRHRTWRKPDRPSVAMAGRIAPQKDPDFYIQFGEMLRKAVPGVRLSWIGDGDPASHRQLRDAGIEVTGWLTRSEVADHLARTSLYVHTSRYEGFPLSVLDAAAVGVPVALRRTPSTLGIDLPQADTAAALAELSSRILAGDALSQAIESSRRLDSRHSISAQRASLLQAYELTLGVGTEGVR